MLLEGSATNKQTKFPVNTKIKVHSAEDPGLSKDPIRKPGKGQSIIALHACLPPAILRLSFPPYPVNSISLRSKPPSKRVARVVNSKPELLFW